MRPSRLLVSAIFVLAHFQSLPAQQAGARRHFQESRARIADGDTSGAIAALEKAVEIEPDWAPAQYELGRLFTARANYVETETELRKRAEGPLLKALALDPENPYYLAELGLLRHKQHMHIDAARLLRLAMKRADEQGIRDPDFLSELHFRYARLEELRYEKYRGFRMTPLLRGELQSRVDPLVHPWASRYVADYLEDALEIPEVGADQMEEMVQHYGRALDHDPGHVQAASRLLLHLAEAGRVREYIALAERLVKGHPDRAEFYLYLGLGLHLSGREAEAAEAFGRGLTALPEEDLVPFLDLEPIMRRKPGAAYRELSSEARAAFNDRYWRLNDPLYLTETNERRLEHLSRVVFADLRFSEPATGRRGWETERGLIFIRYGPPVTVARTGVDRRRVYAPLVWTYGDPGPVFVFRQPPGYTHARFAGDYEARAREYRQLQPAKYDNIPSIATMVEIPVQLARFRGSREDRVAVEIHGSLPLDSLAAGVDLEKAEIESGLFLLNPEGRVIVRRTKSRSVRYDELPSLNALRSWRLELPPAGPLVAAVEVRDATTWRAAAARKAFTAEVFPHDSLSLSDILVADAIRRLAPKPRERSDFDIAANPSLEFGRSQPVHIYYEIYGLIPDDEGFVQYDVALAVRIEKLYREGGLAHFLGALADAWGFSLVGDDRLELRFSREVDLEGRDRASEYMNLDLQKAPAGEYEILLRVHDPTTRRIARRVRQFRIPSDN